MYKRERMYREREKGSKRWIGERENFYRQNGFSRELKTLERERRM